MKAFAGWSWGFSYEVKNLMEIWVKLLAKTRGSWYDKTE
jgi:hypothetical protein